VWQGDLKPEAPLHRTFEIGNAEVEPEVVLEQANSVLLRYSPSEIVAAKSPLVASEPPLPEEAETADELFLIGLHLEQYRHPTRDPEVYWLEALRRDAGDSRANLALGRWHLRRGEFANAERCLRASIARLTARNPNPYDGEPHYNLGLTLSYLQRSAEAYEAFYKSTWNAAWRGPAYHRLAEIDCSRGEWTLALDHLNRSLRADADNLNAANLKVMVLQRLGRDEEAEALLQEVRALDPLDIFSRFLATAQPPLDGQQRLDLAFDLSRPGLLEEALRVLSAEHSSEKNGDAPLLLYAKAQVLDQLGREDESRQAYHEAAMSDPDYVFPSLLEELLLLEQAMRANPQDARAPYYLGNLLYDRRRHKEAIAHWERAAELDPDFPTTWRNLGFGYFNILHDPGRALSAFSRARKLAPGDARILYEQDQLLRRTGESPEVRLAILEAHADLVEQRDDLTVELASLLNSTGHPDRALALLLSRQFQPWEGGEGLVLAQYVRANLLLGQLALGSGDSGEALEYFKTALNMPESVGEARHLLMNLSMIDYWLGVAFAGNGDPAAARRHWERAATKRDDFQQMQVQSISDMTYWSAMALRRLGRDAEARTLFCDIRQYALALDQQTPKIDYFATSLPALLLFEEDLKKRQTIASRFLEAQALLGLGEEQNAKHLLREVLQMDRSYAGAIDLLYAHERLTCWGQRYPRGRAGKLYRRNIASTSGSSRWLPLWADFCSDMIGWSSEEPVNSMRYISG
jgi:tetratricopeptide (TPR) repeat protein